MTDIVKPLVIFSHGKVSGPKGSRIQALSKIAERMGFEVESLDYRRLPTNERVVKLNNHLANLQRPYILVGTSMGGYVSAVAGIENHPLGMFLISPAIYLDGYAEAELENVKCPVTIVHGWKDDIVPVTNVIKFAQAAGANLHIFDGGHRLREKLSETESCFEQFLRQCFIESSIDMPLKDAVNQ
ncbi:alpha/beta hydrolase [Kangiella koreensis]|uniref:Alpha/beta fold family hydrolase n=1 Tax=Kangiella koreensis (strain DSM 16069 / JCM 12317 / KCTC 12182 / SW-125) TaxID=523791 RepID=C7R7I0_KANKD|nr:alpha/beta fold family hydrolase [Kangiella koreensis]ACV25729.1 alpha/beta fold family hydrolase [Kangiella koreensis DSM 16069]